MSLNVYTCPISPNTLREGPGPQPGRVDSAKGQQAGRGLTKHEAGEGRVVHARVSAQFCPGHTRVQSIDGHTCAWGGEEKLGGGGRHQVPSLLGNLTWPALSSRAPLFPTLELTRCPLALKPPCQVVSSCKTAVSWLRGEEPLNLTVCKNHMEA